MKYVGLPPKPAWGHRPQPLLRFAHLNELYARSGEGSLKFLRQV